jgi:hypothetical protein
MISGAVVDEKSMKFTDFDFRNIAELTKYNNNEIERLTFTQTAEYIPPYKVNENDPESDLNELAKWRNFHDNILKIINHFRSTEIEINNFPHMTDDFFGKMNLPRWENLVVLTVTNCRRLTSKFFRWVSKNCESLQHFKFSCSNRYHTLEDNDLLNFFTKNKNSIETVCLQSYCIGPLMADFGCDTLLDVVKRCDKLSSVIFEVKSLIVPVGNTEIYSLFSLPLLDRFLLKEENRIIVDFDGIGLIINHEGDFCSTNSFTLIMKSLGNHLKYIELNNFLLSVEMLTKIKIFLNESLISVKFLRCGTEYNYGDVLDLVNGCPHLNLVVVTEGDISFGDQTGFLFMTDDSRRVLLAVKKDDRKWTLEEYVTEPANTFLDDCDREWLEDESNMRKEGEDDMEVNCEGKVEDGMV